MAGAGFVSEAISAETAFPSPSSGQPIHRKAYTLQKYYRMIFSLVFLYIFHIDIHKRVKKYDYEVLV